MLRQIQTIDCINNGRSSRDVMHWFVDCHFEGLSFDFGRCHLGFLETEVNIFGKEDDAEGESRNARRL